MKASFTWAARREGNLGYVREGHPDGTFHDFPAMPSDRVQAFIRARRQYVHHMMKTKSWELVVEQTPDWKYLQ